MSNTDVLLEGFKLMVLGMGWVLVFLIVMIICMGILRRVLAPYAGMLEPPPKAAPKPKAAASGDDAQLAAIAAAAVEAVRSQK